MSVQRLARPLVTATPPYAPHAMEPRFDVTGRFADAVSWALALHAGQTRKGTDIPYAAHLLAVAALVMEHGGDEDEAIAALLHDGPEDQGGEGTLAEVEQRFGRRTAAIVAACTDSYEDPKPPWRARKERHLAHLRHADASVRLVTAADKVHNLRSLVRDLRLEGERVWDRFRTRTPADVIWYHRSVLELLRGAERDARLSPLLDALERLLDELDGLVAGGPAKPTP